MSRFIKMTSPFDGAIHLQPDDVKAVHQLDPKVGSGCEVLLYGAAEVWIRVNETPAEVIELVEGPKHILGATPSTAFFGRN
jgi:hypothetical protein